MWEVWKDSNNRINIAGDIRPGRDREDICLSVNTLEHAHQIAATPELLANSKRLAEKVKRANAIQRGGKISAEDWAELYQLTNEMFAVIWRAERK